MRQKDAGEVETELELDRAYDEAAGENRLRKLLEPWHWLYLAALAAGIEV